MLNGRGEKCFGFQQQKNDSWLTPSPNGKKRSSGVLAIAQIRTSPPRFPLGLTHCRASVIKFQSNLGDVKLSMETQDCFITSLC